VVLAMTKIRCLLLSVIFAGACLCAGAGVRATSWVSVPPEEVLERADVIVTGRYDFTSEMSTSQAPIFVGYAFDVERVYRGDVPRRLTVGIDFFDVPGSREFQDKGGAFLLLLEYGEGYEYPIPVAGPNGMVPLSDGTVDTAYLMGERNAFFAKFLKKRTPVAVYETSAFKTAPAFNSRVLIGAIVGAVGVPALAAYYFARKKKTRPNRA
jgi:hypothetical protein